MEFNNAVKENNQHSLRLLACHYTKCSTLLPKITYNDDAKSYGHGFTPCPLGSEQYISVQLLRNAVKETHPSTLPSVTATISVFIGGKLENDTVYSLSKESRYSSR